MIDISDLYVAFGGLTALNRINVKLDAPVVGVIGPNGAGKTTFLNSLSGFVRPQSGRVVAFGTSLLDLPPHRRARWGLRRSFQKEQVVDEISVEDNIGVVLDPLGLSRGEREKALTAAFEFAGLSGLRKAKAAELNAFERRMTELARCVVGAPRVIMLDEPGAGFSQGEVSRLRDFILGIAAFNGAMTLLIDHDVDLIRTVCVNTMVLDFGILIAHDATEAVMADARVRAVYLGVEEAA